MKKFGLDDYLMLCATVRDALSFFVVKCNHQRRSSACQIRMSHTLSAALKSKWPIASMITDLRALRIQVGTIGISPLIQFIHNDYCRIIRFHWLGSLADRAVMLPSVRRALKSQWVASVLYPLWIG